MLGTEETLFVSMALLSTSLNKKGRFNSLYNYFNQSNVSERKPNVNNMIHNCWESRVAPTATILFEGYDIVCLFLCGIFNFVIKVCVCVKLAKLISVPKQNGGCFSAA